MRIQTVERGVIPSFERGLTDDDGNPVHAEVSAAVWTGEWLLLASDKNVPGAHRSPIFALACDDQGRPRVDTLTHLTADLIQTGEKYEDFAMTVAGDYVIATTGFDRVDHDAPEQHRYNRLLAWPTGRSDAAFLISRSVVDGVPSSVDLRADLGAALGVDYFKVEGLAAAPGASGGTDRLLFGIREAGRHHDDFDYVCKVVSVDYVTTAAGIELAGAFRVIYEFDPARWDAVRYPVGLSSVEYDRFNQQLLMLTSYEIEDNDGSRLGAYLWSLSMPAFDANEPPQLALDAGGEPLEFVNKAEGLAVLDEQRLFVAYDNDRETGLEAERERSARAPHEAPYTLMRTQD